MSSRLRAAPEVMEFETAMNPRRVEVAELGEQLRQMLEELQES